MIRDQKVIRPDQIGVTGQLALDFPQKDAGGLEVASVEATGRPVAEGSAVGVAASPRNTIALPMASSE